jgi:hypothetical protein
MLQRTYYKVDTCFHFWSEDYCNLLSFSPPYLNHVKPKKYKNHYELILILVRLRFHFCYHAEAKAMLQAKGYKCLWLVLFLHCSKTERIIKYFGKLHPAENGSRNIAL